MIMNYLYAFTYIRSTMFFLLFYYVNLGVGVLLSQAKTASSTIRVGDEPLPLNEDNKKE